MSDINCIKCDRVYSRNSVDFFTMTQEGVCQICQAELSGKYADGRGAALTNLIAAAQNLRQSSADFTASGDQGEICYADAVHESVDLLIDALNEYEKGLKA